MPRYLPRYHALADGDMSAAAVYGDPSNIEFLTDFAVHAVWRGIQASATAKLANVTGATHATGTVTIAADLALDEKVTIESIDFVFKYEFAKNVITCAAVEVGDTVTIGAVTYTAIADNGTPTAIQFKIGSGGGATQNNEAANNLAYAITGGFATHGATAAAVDAVVTITSSTAGAAGNAIACTSSNGTRLAVTTAGGFLANGYDPANDEVPLGATPALNGTYLAQAILNSETTGIVDVVTASHNNAGVVTITSVGYGTAMNSLTLAKTGAHITVSGAGTLTGAGAGHTITVNTVVFTAVAGPATSASEFDVSGTNIVDAAALAAAVNASEDVAIVDTLTADAGGTDTVTFTAVAEGTSGNSLALAKSGNFTISGANFTGGGFPVGVVSLQASPDYVPDRNAGTWINLQDQMPSGLQPAGAAGNATYQWARIAYGWVRPSYTKTSGVGVIDLYVEGKGI